MTEMDIRDIVKKTVAEHGPEDAAGILWERAQNDREFMFALASYGFRLWTAPLVAEAAADEMKH